MVEDLGYPFDELPRWLRTVPLGAVFGGKLPGGFGEFPLSRDEPDLVKLR